MEMAVRLLNAWIVDYPNDPRPHLMLAEFSLDVMDIDNAMKELRLALSIDPSHGRAALALCELMLKQQQPAEALKLFQTAELSKALRSTALAWQARCFRTVGRDKEARSVLAVALEETPNSAIANIEQSQLEVASRKFPAAIKRLRTLLDREPYRYEARSILSSALRSVGQTEESREQTAIATAANSALIHARHLARDVAIDDDNVATRAEIGQIYFQYGDPRKAREWLESVLMFDPQHQPTKRTLDELNKKSPPES
jgi:Tfp pilus assembly protein PilF